MSETSIFPSFRTDLADEAYELSRKCGEYDDDGLESISETICGFETITLKIKNDRASKQIGKAVGSYTTFKIGNLSMLDSLRFEEACNALSSKIRGYLPCLDGILVVGLGNKEITADSVGHHTVSNILVTRHLKGEAKNLYEALSLRETSAILPGVLGSTGIEAAQIVKGIVDIVKPAALIVIDALCAKSVARLCTSVQISNYGITPGSGVANHRHAISKETIGIPVVSIGIPTVVSTSAIAREFLGKDEQDSSFGLRNKNEYYVTSKDCDTQILSISKLAGFAINLAVQESLSFQDIQNLLLR